jgi:hypothetical protein
MENDLFFEAETNDMLTGSGMGDTQLAAVSSAEPPYADALTRPFDAAQVAIPQGENIVRVPVAPGEVVELPFPPDAHYLARIDNGNLAIKVGDVTVILQGYVDAAGQTPPVIEASNGQPLDIATILASTDPNVEIETAAGPAAGPQGADNTGALFAQLGEGAGLGGFTGAGALDGTDGPGNGPVDQTGTLFVQFGELAGVNNLAPIANDDKYLAFKDTPLVIPVDKGVLGNDTDPDGDALTVTSNTPPSHGAVVVNADGSFTYTPNAGYFGKDSFDYTIDDGNGNTSTATVDLYVDALPQWMAGFFKQVYDEDTANHPADLNWVIKDLDDTQFTITVDERTLPDGVTYDAAGKRLNFDTFGKYDYLAAGENATFTIKFTITDAHGGSIEKDVILTITGVADAKDAVNDTIITNVGSGVQVSLPEWTVLANDKDSST